MAIDAQTLKRLGSLYNNNTPPEWMVMKLSLLSQILLAMNPMADVSPAALLAQADQYQPYGPQCWQLFELALLGDILNNGISPVGGVQIVTYIADPNAELVKPANVNAPAVAYQATGLGATFVWNIAGQIWV
jgi:hypothetical protein